MAALKLELLTPSNVRSAMAILNKKRDGVLHACDEAFYTVNEIPERLFAYVRENRTGIYL